MIKSSIPDKLDALKDLLRGMESVLVAYSGGVDSTFLLRVAHDLLGDRAVAATALSDSYPQAELEEAKQYAREMGVRHILVETNEMEREEYRRNDSGRCYFCKTELFEKLGPIAANEGLRHVLYGEISDDRGDHRPGARAAREQSIRAPLAEVGLSKLEIRRLSRDLGLATWEKPSMACLASRIPYGGEVTPEKLQRVERAEAVLRELGLRQYRVRHHDTIARIELDPRDFEELVRSPVRDLVITRFREIGYLYVTLDLQGYRTGSLNEALKSST